MIALIRKWWSQGASSTTKKTDGTPTSPQTLPLHSKEWRRLGAPTVVELSDARFYYLSLGMEVPFIGDTSPLKRYSPFSPPKPVVVLTVPDGASADFPQQAVKAFFESKDDVFSGDFLTDTVILQGPAGSQVISKLQKGQNKFKVRLSTGKDWTPEQILHIQLQSPSHSLPLPEGPYFLTSEGALAQAWRLYDDVQDAFCVTFTPDTQKSEPYTFHPLGAAAGDGLWRQIAVPSRLYSTPSSALPLAGMRMTIKDNYKIAGVKTTQNNRAFTELNPPESETAELVRMLIELGAVILGKTKMCAFASSEEATDQWVDFHAPFNPRGDGYQSCSGSTSGGGAALASYPFVDFSVGTDTTGSIRWPAAWNGLFGLRTTWQDRESISGGAIDTLKGVYRSCRAMDTVGLLSRDLAQLEKVLMKTLPFTVNTAPRFPTRILYCTDFFPQEPEQQKLVDAFMTTMKSVLGVDEIEDVNIANRWAKHPPPEDKKRRDIRKYLETTAFYHFYYDGYNEFSEFRETYENKYKKPVFVGPYMRWKWDQGIKINEDEKQAALSEKRPSSMAGGEPMQVMKAKGEMEVYKKWFFDNILPRDSSGHTDAILILPCGSGKPKYRDLPNPPPGPVPAFSPNYIASMLGLPQIVLPISNVTYESRISKRMENLPVVASFAGAPGSDLMLVQLGKAVLDKAEIKTTVKTGRDMY